MDNPQVQIYVSCSIVTTLAFIYLIYNFVILSKKKLSLDHLSSVDLQSLSHSISEDLTSFYLNQQSQQICNDSALLTSRTKKIINSRKQRDSSQHNHYGQYYYLPNSDKGLLEMKALNKKYIKNNQKAACLGLVKQKKKKNSSYFDKKYCFHKTVLVTIYEQLQY